MLKAALGSSTQTDTTSTISNSSNSNAASTSSSASIPATTSSNTNEASTSSSASIPATTSSNTNEASTSSSASEPITNQTQNLKDTRITINYEPNDSDDSDDSDDSNDSVKKLLLGYLQANDLASFKETLERLAQSNVKFKKTKNTINNHQAQVVKNLFRELFEIIKATIQTQKFTYLDAIISIFCVNYASSKQKNNVLQFVGNMEEQKNNVINIFAYVCFDRSLSLDDLQNYIIHYGINFVETYNQIKLPASRFYTRYHTSQPSIDYDFLLNTTLLSPNYYSKDYELRGLEFYPIKATHLLFQTTFLKNSTPQHLHKIQWLLDNGANRATIMEHFALHNSNFYLHVHEHDILQKIHCVDAMLKFTDNELTKLFVRLGKAFYFFDNAPILVLSKELIINLTIFFKKRITTYDFSGLEPSEINVALNYFLSIGFVNTYAWLHNVIIRLPASSFIVDTNEKVIASKLTEYTPLNKTLLKGLYLLSNFFAPFASYITYKDNIEINSSLQSFFNKNDTKTLSDYLVAFLSCYYTKGLFNYPDKQVTLNASNQKILQSLFYNQFCIVFSLFHEMTSSYATVKNFLKLTTDNNILPTATASFDGHIYENFFSFINSLLNKFMPSYFANSRGNKPYSNLHIIQLHKLLWQAFQKKVFFSSEDCVDKKILDEQINTLLITICAGIKNSTNSFYCVEGVFEIIITDFFEDIYRNNCSIKSRLTSDNNNKVKLKSFKDNFQKESSTFIAIKMQELKSFISFLHTHGIVSSLLITSIFKTIHLNELNNLTPQSMRTIDKDHLDFMTWKCLPDVSELLNTLTLPAPQNSIVCIAITNDLIRDCFINISNETSKQFNFTITHAIKELEKYFNTLENIWDFYFKKFSINVFENNVILSKYFNFLYIFIKKASITPILGDQNTPETFVKNKLLCETAFTKLTKILLQKNKDIGCSFFISYNVTTNILKEVAKYPTLFPAHQRYFLETDWIRPLYQKAVEEVAVENRKKMPQLSVQNDRQSTHSQPVHLSTAQSAQALYKKYFEDKFAELENTAEKSAKLYEYKLIYGRELFQYMLTSIKKYIMTIVYPKDVTNTDIVIKNKECLLSFALQNIQFLKMENEENKAYFNDKPFIAYRYFKLYFANSTYANWVEPISKIKLGSVLLTVWIAIQDETIFSPDDQTRLKNLLLLALYNIATEYKAEFEAGTVQTSASCTSGTFNSLIELLDGEHPLVKIHRLTVSYLGEYLTNYFDKKLQAMSEKEIQALVLESIENLLKEEDIDITENDFKIAAQHIYDKNSRFADLELSDKYKTAWTEAFIIEYKKELEFAKITPEKVKEWLLGPWMLEDIPTLKKHLQTRYSPTSQLAVTNNTLDDSACNEGDFIDALVSEAIDELLPSSNDAMNLDKPTAYRENLQKTLTPYLDSKKLIDIIADYAEESTNVQDSNNENRWLINFLESISNLSFKSLLSSSSSSSNTLPNFGFPTTVSERFEITDMPQDGSCFFHAVFTQIKQLNLLEDRGLPTNQDEAIQIMREQALQYISREHIRYQAYLGYDKQSFIAANSNTEDWADHVLIDATARAFNLCIHIHRTDGEINEIDSATNSSTHVFIGYQVGMHYLSLKTRETATTLSKNEMDVEPVDCAFSSSSSSSSSSKRPLDEIENNEENDENDENKNKKTKFSH